MAVDITDSLLDVTCNLCSTSFIKGDTILTAVDCGHSFHNDVACTRERSRLQGYTGLPVFKGVCPVQSCQHRDATITLFFRNMPLEAIVAGYNHPATTSVKGEKVPATRKPPPLLSKHSKRMRFDESIATSDDSQHIRLSRQNYATEDAQANEELDIPDLPPTEDSDPEEDEELLAKVAKADQMRQQTMYNVSVENGDDDDGQSHQDLHEDNEDVLGDAARKEEKDTVKGVIPERIDGIRLKAIPDTAYELDTPDLPPGMPPSSQWRRPLK